MSNSKSPSLKGSIYGSCTLIKTDLIDQNPGKRGEQLDLLQDTIGSFGRWQFKISFLMALLKFPIAWFQLGIIFLAPPIGYWCKPPKEYQSLATDIWLNVSKPFINGTHQNDTEDYCSMMDVINGTPSNIPCPFGYQYNTTVFTSSIQTEWDLVCKRARLVDLTQITLMFGVLIGNIVFGVAADRIGRKKVLMICIVFQSIFGFLAALSPWYWGFVISRFLLAICNGGIVIASFVMCMEVVGGVWRTIVPILYQIPYGLGNSLMGGLAYFFRSWRHLQLVLAGLSALYIFYAWIIPESPRWLMAVGKKKEATEVLEKAANYNKMDPDTIKATLKGYRELEDAKEKPKLSVIFVNKTLRTRTILLSINWLICGITFYAFNQYLGHIGHNLFLTVGVSGFVALPGTLFCVYIVGKCGRRWTISCAHMLIAACFLMILFIPKGVFRLDWPRVGFAGLGVVGLSIAMPALYLFTGELYPTVIRNAGVGGAVMSSRVGSMLAPLVAALHDVSPFLPLLVMSALTFSLAVLVLFLPETKGKQLPERIEDLETENLDIRNGNYITVSTKEEEMVGEREEEETEEREEGRDIGKAEEVY